MLSSAVPEFRGAREGGDADGDVTNVSSFYQWHRYISPKRKEFRIRKTV